MLVHSKVYAKIEQRIKVQHVKVLEMEMILIILLWLVLLFAGMQYVGNGQLAFSKENAGALRGICAVEILIGHLGIATNSIFLFANRKAGILFVGIFFALSGYGLMYSMSNKEGYLDSFLWKRLPRLILPAYTAYFISVIVQSIVSKDISYLFKAVNSKAFFEGTNWFVWELFVFYIIFFLCTKLDKSLKKSHCLLLCASLAFVGIAFYFDLDNPWYGSTLCFWMGIIYYLKRDEFENVFVRKHLLKSVIVCSIGMGVSIITFFAFGGVIGDLIARNAASVLFVIMIIILLYRFKVGNRVSFSLGRYSYEIFLFHPMVITILKPWIENDLLYSLSVIIGSIGISFVYRNSAKVFKAGIRKCICKRYKAK